MKRRMSDSYTLRKFILILLSPTATHFAFIFNPPYALYAFGFILIIFMVLNFSLFIYVPPVFTTLVRCGFGFLPYPQTRNLPRQSWCYQFLFDHSLL